MPKSPDPIAPLGAAVHYVLSEEDMRHILHNHCSSFGVSAGTSTRAVVAAVEGELRSLNVFAHGHDVPIAFFGGRAMGDGPSQWRAID